MIYTHEVLVPSIEAAKAFILEHLHESNPCHKVRIMVSDPTGAGAFWERFVLLHGRAWHEGREQRTLDVHELKANPCPPIEWDPEQTQESPMFGVK